jgi:hypothetical protein
MSGCGGKMMSKGGKVSPVKKKMAMGGTSGKVTPLYSNNPRTEQGRILKNGGSASLPICTGGMVRDANGKCVMERTSPKYKAGGATKNAKLAQETKPFNKVTRGDVLKRILQKKGK